MNGSKTTALLIMLSAAVVLAGSYHQAAYASDTDDHTHNGDHTHDGDRAETASAYAAQYPPPLQQQRDGAALFDIRCNDPKELYVRDSQAPVCITESTYELLSGYGLDLVLASSLGVESPAMSVQRVVEETVSLYESEGEEAFAIINAMRSTDPRYPFVIDYETQAMVAHAAIPQLVGVDARTIVTPDRSHEEILADLERDGGTWVEYRFPNPATGEEERKITWLLLHDGLVFGSGYYVNPITQVQEVVVEAIKLYETEGADAFDTIDATSGALYLYYPFVLDTVSATIVAHGAHPDRVGNELTLLDVTTDPILEILRTGAGAWAEYVYDDPVDGLDKLKRSWLVLREGYIFGSGYYVTPEVRVQEVVEETVALYETESEGAFAIINAMRSTDPTYPFVFDYENQTLVANAALPHLVGLDVSMLVSPDRPVEHIMADLERDGGTWVEYRFPNPATGQEERKVTWLLLHDGLVFGSGYYVNPTTEVKEVVAGIIELYASEGVDAFAIIDAKSIEPELYYPFVLDTVSATIAAHGAHPDRVGNELTLLDVTSDPIMEILRTGAGAWAEYLYDHPIEGTDQHKRSWLVLRDGYIFGSGYYITPEVHVQEVAHDAVHLYSVDGEEAFAAITEMRSTDPSYPFVYRLGDRVLVAHGSNPDLVGIAVDDLITPDRPLDQISAELERDGTAWVEYRALNPATGQEEHKRSWLELYDDYVFGSGYYVDPVAEVLASVENAIELYKSDSTGAFAAIDAMMSTDPSYPFVVNPDDGTILAHGASPDRVGAQSVILGDSAIASLPPEVIVERLQDGGLWVEYLFLNPATGQEEQKRTWLVLHDGYVFGAGYYVSLEAYVQDVVHDAVNSYLIDGTGVFASITEMRSTDPSYPFVYRLGDRVLVAHGSNPDLVGIALDDLITPDRPLDQISADLEKDGTAWMEYMFLNPATGQVEQKRTWLELYDGYVFGAGYYVPVQ